MIFPKKQLEWTLEVGFFLTFVIFVFHGPWIMHWVIWNILSVKAITPSILIRFSKFWCLNISAFQDPPFSEHPRGTCPRGQKRVLKIVNEKWKSQKLKKMTFPSSCEQTLGRILDLHKISDLLGQRNDVLQTLASWRKLASKVWPLMTSNDL